MSDAAEEHNPDEYEEVVEDKLEEEAEEEIKDDPKDEDDLEGYGTKVKKRINKEVGKRKAETDRADLAEKRLAKEQAETDIRIRKLEEQIENSELSSMDVTKERLTEQYQEAVDEDDNEAKEKALDALTKHNTRKNEIETNQKKRGEEKKEEPAREQHPAAKGFLRRHEKDFEESEEMLDRAMEIEKELRDDGQELGFELYREIDKQLAKEFTGDGEEEEEPTPRRQTPVSGKSRGGGKRRRSGTHLTEADKNTMAKYGMDHKDPAAIKSFLKHKGGE